MGDRSYERYQKLNEALWTDEELAYLRNRLRKVEPEFQTAMNTLSPEHRDSITEYLGILAEISERRVELCCFLP